MLKIRYSVVAENSLLRIAKFVDSVNTNGSGDRWKLKFHKKISKYAMPIQYNLCRHKVYAKQGFSCVAVDDWIIIFKIENDIFYVKQIILGSGLY